jgi:hypothetical protein
MGNSLIPVRNPAEAGLEDIVASISCCKAPIKGYSVPVASVITKYPIRFFLPCSVSGLYCVGPLGKEARITDCASVKSAACTQKYA